MPISRPRILIAEDQFLVAMNLQDMLEELGFAVEATSTVKDSLEAARELAFAAAILDYNLHGQTIDVVARALSDNGVPYALTSGMNREDIQLGLDRPMLAKPYDFHRVRLVVGELTALPHVAIGAARGERVQALRSST